MFTFQRLWVHYPMLLRAVCFVGDTDPLSSRFSRPIVARATQGHARSPVPSSKGQTAAHHDSTVLPLEPETAEV